MPKKGKTKMSRKAIPENFELSDDEATMIKLNEEHKLTSKHILFDCPVCKCKLQLRNEIAINPKGIICRCNSCSFKLTKNDKTMSVNKDDEGGITLDSQDHSVSFSWNRITTPPTDDEKNKNDMIKNVAMNTRSAETQSVATPRKSKKQMMSEMD